MNDFEIEEKQKKFRKEREMNKARLKDFWMEINYADNIGHED